MKLVILLTATIKVQIKGGNFTSQERCKMYSDTLRYYSKEIGKKYPIVFVENSDYNLQELRGTFDNSLDIEFLQLKPGTDIPFDSEKGKGYNEYLMIKEAVYRSVKLAGATHFLKITGRYPMLNINSIIQEIEHFSKTKYFMCDIKDTCLYEMIGSSNEGHWGDSRFWATNKDFYKKNIADCYKWMDDRVRGRYAEDYIFNLSQEHRKDSNYNFRFKHQVRFDGFSGSVSNISNAHGNLNYNSTSSKIRYVIRSILRRLFPIIWF